MSGRRLQFGVAVIDNKLYVVGGRDGLKTLNTVECFNPVAKIWIVMPPMSTHRHGLGKSHVAHYGDILKPLVKMSQKMLKILINW
jgi:hypothetical protein